MTNFEWAMNQILSVEGGFSNDPLDRGGITNFGITQSLMSSYLGRTATIEDMKALTPEKAAEIYCRFFWDPMLLDQVKDPRIAYILFDQAVNRGVRVAVKNMQETLNKNLKTPDILEDGMMGPRTITILNDQDPTELGLWYIERCQAAYARVVEYNQSQSRFLRGWLARTHKLQRLFWDKGNIA